MFLLSNNDRFGISIDRKRPYDSKPPPGAYDNIPEKRVKYAMIHKGERQTSKRPKYKAPGPAYYKPMAEPKSISYHLNVQNLWMR